MTSTPAVEPGTASARFRAKIELAIGPLAAACTALVDNPRLRVLWPEYLVVQHQIIRATVPLTIVAGERTRELRDDPLSKPLAAYLDEHVDEERGHDETLLDDLDLLGLPRGEVLDRVPPPSVATLVGAQYYWVLHHHPLAFLGFVGVMEGFPPTSALIELLVERTGYPRESFRTFSEHAELDPGHRDHLDRVLDALPLTAEDEALLGISAITTAGLAAKPLEELLGR